MSFGNHDVAFPVERYEERLVAQVGLATGAGVFEAFFNGLVTGLTSKDCNQVVKAIAIQAEVRLAVVVVAIDIGRELTQHVTGASTVLGDMQRDQKSS